MIRLHYTECKYGGPLGRRPGRVAWKWGCPEKSCLVDGLVCFISLCLLVFVLLDTTRRDRNCPTFATNKGGFPLSRNFYVHTFPRVRKETLLLRDILCLKRRSCLPPPALYSDGIARSKYYGGITKRMNFNYPRRWNKWKHSAKWHHLGSKCDRFTHFLRYSSLKCSKQTFTVRSAIVNSFISSVFPSEAIGETEKNSFSPEEDFTPF